VLSDDPLRVSADKLAGLEVLLTVVDGRVVHRSGDFARPAPQVQPPTIGPPSKKQPGIGPPRQTAPPKK
jgi:hypothetical protein